MTRKPCLIVRPPPGRPGASDELRPVTAVRPPVSPSAALTIPAAPEERHASGAVAGRPRRPGRQTRRRSIESGGRASRRGGAWNRDEVRPQLLSVLPSRRSFDGGLLRAVPAAGGTRRPARLQFRQDRRALLLRLRRPF